MPSNVQKQHRKAYNLENNQCTYMSSDKHMNTNILYDWLTDSETMLARHTLITCVFAFCIFGKKRDAKLKLHW